MISVGIDCGAKNTKTVIMKDKEIIGKGLSLTGFDQDAAVKASFEAALKDAGISESDVAKIGGTGAGKTSMLNALLSLMSQNDKIVTVEEVPELSPPVTNWTQLNSRESFNFGEGPSGNISLFDLIKVSLRYRPDYVIVGEVRGEEAYVLFQALATGHGGLCTMHADSIDRVVKRLTSPPMNVSEVYIPLMNIALYIQRVELPNKKDGLSFGRRVRNVSEIVEFNNYNEISRWNPINDTFITSFKDSYILQQISQSSGRNMDQLMEELDKREKYLKEIIESGIDDQKEVAEKILSYYNTQREEKEPMKGVVSMFPGRIGNASSVGIHVSRRRRYSHKGWYIIWG